MAVSDGRSFYVAQYGIWATTFDLTCFDARTGRRIWQELVWADNPGGGEGPPLEDPLNLVLHGDEVFAFGVGGGAYAEAFSVEDGSPRFKFSSSYWSAPSEGWQLPWGKPSDQP